MHQRANSQIVTQVLFYVEYFPDKLRWCWNEQVCQGVKCTAFSTVPSRHRTNALGTRVLEYIFEVFILMEIMGHVHVLMLNVLIFYKYI